MLRYQGLRIEHVLLLTIGVGVVVICIILGATVVHEVRILLSMVLPLVLLVVQRHVLVVTTNESV